MNGTLKNTYLQRTRPTRDIGFFAVISIASKYRDHMVNIFALSMNHYGNLCGCLSFVWRAEIFHCLWSSRLRLCCLLHWITFTLSAGLFIQVNFIRHIRGGLSSWKSGLNNVRWLDLKLDNIMMTIEDQSVIKDFVNEYLEVPIEQKKDLTGRTVYLSHNNFGPLKSLKGVLPKLVDYGLSHRLEPGKLGHHPIQPDYYRAPEVILGKGWTYSADIWNLGVLVRFLCFNIERPDLV